ncbi:MAG: type II methionyl aminopeptidase [Nanoarchaeota archaeon]|nr:type II methionyl aminopeptidase [Nanoarchaeota archaeon]
MNSEEVEKIKQAGEIARQVVVYAKEVVKSGMLLLEVVNKIEDKIVELGAKPAFPVNLSVNEIAAHCTPSFNDSEVAFGLLKVDIGVHIKGYVADTAFSLDLEDSDENKRLIEAAEAGLKAGLEKIGYGVKLGEIGKNVQEAISSYGFSPIQNLSGHEIKQYDLHAGLNIPNYDNKSDIELDEGLYAVEPFATNGSGKVRDGKPSGIYHLIKESNVRDNFAREVLKFIVEEYDSLPFCSRWIYKKFGSRGLLALRQIEQAGVLHQYPQLVEVNRGKVAQAEHSVLITKEVKIVTTNV